MFQKTEKVEILPNSFYEISVTLINTKTKDITSEGSNRLITLMSTNAENPKQNNSKSNPATCKQDYTPWLIGPYPSNARLIYHPKVDQCTTPY